MRNKYLLVANCNGEDVSWTKDLPQGWRPVFSTLERPLARETSAYLEMISRFDGFLAYPDEIAMCQGDPFPHCANFLRRLAGDWTALGAVHECDPTGLPQEPGLDLHAWAEVLGLPKLEKYRFVGGSGYRFPGTKIFGRSVRFWRTLQGLCNLVYDDGRQNRASWVVERLWPQILWLEL